MKPSFNFNGDFFINRISNCSLIIAGVGFVLPYNSFIIASDYWIQRFPTRTIELDISTTYIVVAFGSVLLNNVFISIAPFRLRILFGKSQITCNYLMLQNQ